MQRFAAVLLLVFSCAAWADEARYRQLAEELVGLSHAEQTVSKWHDHFHEETEELVDTVSGGRDEAELSQDERHAIQLFRARGFATLDEALDWGTLHELVLSMYMQAFSEEELEQIVLFLKTPAGIKLMDRLPVLEEGVTGIVRQQINAVRPHLGEIERDFRSGYAEGEAVSPAVRTVPVNPPVPPAEIVQAPQPPAPVLRSVSKKTARSHASATKRTSRTRKCKDPKRKYPSCRK